MIWFRCIFIYIILVYLWTGFLKLFEILLSKYKRWFLKWSKRRQDIYLIENKIKKLVKSIKFEMFLEDKINKITPYFPYRNTKSYSDEELMYQIRKNYDIFFFYLKRLLPLKFSNLIIIIFIIYYYLKINILDFLSNLLTWKNIKQIGNPLPLIPSLLAFTLLIVSLYFTSRSGLFRKAKNKVKVEEIENKIKFHKENRILLSSLLYNGYKNVEHMLFKRKSIISEVKERKDETKLSFEWLQDLNEINELNEFVNNSENNRRDLFPFFLGIHHISFYKLHEIYNETFSQRKNRINKLNSIFLTKQYMEGIVRNPYYTSKFEENLNKDILKSIKTIIYIEKYLDMINNQINKSHSIYTFFAFITNKDK